MGNEASSVRIHAALTAEDIKGLRAGFPGAGNGPPPAQLTFEPWGSCWRPDELRQLEKLLKQGQPQATNPGESGAGISFHAYQELAGTAIRGTTEDRVKLIFRLLDRTPDKTIKSGELLVRKSHFAFLNPP